MNREEYDKRRLAQTKRRKRKVQKIKRMLVIIIAACIFVGATVLISNGMFLIDRIAMSGKQVDLKEYYGIETENEMAVIINNQLMVAEQAGMLWEDEPYVEYTIVQKYLNNRVYVDINENLLLYTLPTGTISAGVGSKEYTFQKEKKSSEHPLFKMEGQTAFISLSFVKELTDMEYDVYSNDSVNRVVIETYQGEITLADAKKPMKILTKAERKAPLLKKVEKKTSVRVIKEDDNWVLVRTEDGYIGYVRSRYLRDQRKETIQRDFEEVEYKNISKDYTINLAWHMVTNRDANNDVLSKIANSKGLTTLSPTWFTISDTKGNIQSIASSTYVNYAHQSQIEVWAQVKDFDGGIDSKKETLALLSHTSARENLISQLMSEVMQHNIDGINVDFELVSKECGEHFIQFIRELSLKCRQNEIVLSVDNYVPSDEWNHYNLKEQALYADYIIIMGYDEYYAGSKESGPVASTAYAKDGIGRALKVVPSKKLINAVPFYSRLWKEVEQEDGKVDISSIAYGMKEAKSLIKAADAEIVVDKATGHNYAQWTEGNVVYKIWLEDEAALESKLKLMKDNSLAGIAAWRLGFDTKEAWDLILKYVN